MVVDHRSTVPRHPHVGWTCPMWTEERWVAEGLTETLARSASKSFDRVYLHS